MQETVSSRGLLILAAISVAALFIAGVIRMPGRAVVQGPVDNELNTPVSDPSPFFTETDSDSDGVPDWQETLMGSDPQVPDTESQRMITSQETPLETATDAVSERLMNQYLFLKNAGAYTEERGERLGGSLAENLHVPTPFVPYTEEEVRRSSGTSRESVEDYRKGMQDAVEPFLGITEPEFVMYARFIETQDTQALEELRMRGLLYKKVAKDVMAVSVPAAATETHLAVANALAYFGTVLESMVQYAPDPIASFSLLHTYNEAEQYVFNTFSALTLYYNTNI